MVYTRWKCDRYALYAVKFFVHDYPFALFLNGLVVTAIWKYASWCSEEMERKEGWWSGYPQWRDPIAERKREKYLCMIRDNDVDIADPKWTGVAKDKLFF